MPVLDEKQQGFIK